MWSASKQYRLAVPWTNFTKLDDEVSLNDIHQTKNRHNSDRIDPATRAKANCASFWYIGSHIYKARKSCQGSQQMSRSSAQKHIPQRSSINRSGNFGKVRSYSWNKEFKLYRQIQAVIGVRPQHLFDHVFIPSGFLCNRFYANRGICRRYPIEGRELCCAANQAVSLTQI